MRTQLLARDVDERSWRLAPVDPAGWLTRSPGLDAIAPDRVRPGSNAEPVVRRRRPRRTEAARIARERELARRRRRRHGRSIVVGRRLVGASVELAPRPVASMRRPGAVSAGTGYRIGRWERLALTGLAAVTMALIVGRVIAAAVAGPVEVVDVTVHPGDTLWSIAATTSPDRDPRAVIDEIRGLNHLSGDVVRVGEVLRVPGSG